MNFSEFLESSQNQTFWENNFIYCFRGKQYPVLFLHNVSRILHTKNLTNHKPQTLQINSLEIPTILSTLSSSFLGETSFYNLCEISTKSDKKNTELLKFLASYEGPNKILFFLSNENTSLEFKTKKCSNINLEDEIDYKLFTQIANFFDKSRILQKQTLIKKVFDKIKTVSLDNCFMLFDYLDLAGVNNAKEFEKFISFLTESKESLHALSKSFFSKNGPECFNIWMRIKDDYSQMFWITFWSEQLWQAFNAIKFLEIGKFIEAKKVGYRLPFLFFNQIWKSCNKEEIAAAHNFIYLADFHLKKGSLFNFFELFFSKYFSGEFSKNNQFIILEEFPASSIYKNRYNSIELI